MERGEDPPDGLLDDIYPKFGLVMGGIILALTVNIRCDHDIDPVSTGNGSEGNRQLISSGPTHGPYRGLISKRGRGIEPIVELEGQDHGISHGFVQVPMHFYQRGDVVNVVVVIDFTIHDNRYGPSVTRYEVVEVPRVWNIRIQTVCK